MKELSPKKISLLSEAEKTEGTQPYSQVSLGDLEETISSLTQDEVWGFDILDWTPPDTQIAGWGLPGHGETKDDCGTFFMRGCLNTEEHPFGQAIFKPMVRRCFDPKCPEDWYSWAKRAASRMTNRIEAAQTLDDTLGEAIHFIASVPKDSWFLPKNRLTDLAYAIAKRVGFVGGCAIYHPFREKPGGRWYFSPHFHMIGYGWIIETKAEFQRSGWICKNAGIRKTVFGTAFYQLTHCGVWYGEGKKHSITWFGYLAYNKLRLPKSEGSHLDQVFCPVCGQKLKRLFWIGFGSEPLPCAGIGGFYFADSAGWVDFQDLWELRRAESDLSHPRYRDESPF